MGRAEREASGSRSLRTTTYEMPWRFNVSASPADGRPEAKSRCTESSARMVSGGVSGMESRTPHGLSPRTCSGSSWLLPHTCVANGAPGATSTRPAGPAGLDAPSPPAVSDSPSPPAGSAAAVLCSSSHAAVSCQYCGIASNAPGGVNRLVQASDVAAVSAASTTTPTATRLSFSGCANAARHTGRGALPGNGIRPSRCAKPRASGNRSSGSSLCRLRSGVPSASRNACTWAAIGEPSPPE